MLLDTNVVSEFLRSGAPGRSILVGEPGLEARARGERRDRWPRLGRAVAVVIDDGQEDDLLGRGTRRAPDGSLHPEQIAHGTPAASE